MSRTPRPVPAPPTLEDVARVAGVSRATVSRVVNGSPTVAPAMADAVRRAVAATGYVPNSAARALVTRRAAAIALVISGAGPGQQIDEHPGRVLADPFYGRIVDGVLRSLRPHRRHPVLILAESQEEREDAVAFVRQGNADGALVIAVQPGDRLPGMLVRANVPAVLFSRASGAGAISSVDLANHDGGRLAAERMAALGRGRAVVVSGPLPLADARDRLDGFRATMARHGAPGTLYEEGDFTQAGGERAMERLLARRPDLDGVFAANDVMALGALHVLRERGRRVPEDVALIGFDDSGVAATSRPSLTTVRQPVEDMAAEMVRLLLDPPPAPTSVLFTPTLVLRASA